MNIDWNAKGYQKDFAFVPKYGEAVLDLIDAAPGALAVDLGCGNGGLTGKLIERGYRCGCFRADAGACQRALPRYNIFTGGCLYVPTAGAGRCHLQQRGTALDRCGKTERADRQHCVSAQARRAAGL
jgi:SAM-dependent methyltransferase